MKHLQLFENVGDNFWLVVYNILNGDISYTLYPDEESAENHIITVVNQERRDLEQDNYNDDMFFSDVEDAMDWYDDTFSNITMTYHKIKLSSHFTGSDKLKRMKDIKKYNL